MDSGKFVAAQFGTFAILSARIGLYTESALTDAREMLSANYP
jgi:hypothetical protein